MRERLLTREDGLKFAPLALSQSTDPPARHLAFLKCRFVREENADKNHLFPPLLWSFFPSLSTTMSTFSKYVDTIPLPRLDMPYYYYALDEIHFNASFIIMYFFIEKTSGHAAAYYCSFSSVVVFAVSSLPSMTLLEESMVSGLTLSPIPSTLAIIFPCPSPLKHGRDRFRAWEG